MMMQDDCWHKVKTVDFPFIISSMRQSSIPQKKYAIELERISSVLINSTNLADRQSNFSDAWTESATRMQTVRLQVTLLIGSCAIMMDLPERLQLFKNNMLQKRLDETELRLKRMTDDPLAVELLKMDKALLYALMCWY
jgi:hypothetical protein